MAIVKSSLLKKISKKYPNFYKKDLDKFFNIILEEIKYSLNKGERVELRGFGTWSTHTQKARVSRKKKKREKVKKKKKKTIHFKMGKDLFERINNEKK